MATRERLTCPLCAQEHRVVPLALGEKALCVRCGALLAQGTRLGRDVALVFSLTGLVLAVPAALLPIATAGKLGNERTSMLFSGVGGLWEGGMKALAVLVLFCGSLVPLTLLAKLAVLHAPFRERLGLEMGPLVRSARVLEHWAIPEVQVLAILIAAVKIGSVVNVHIGSGFWFYCAMALSLVIALHCFKLELNSHPLAKDGTCEGKT